MEELNPTETAAGGAPTETAAPAVPPPGADAPVDTTPTTDTTETPTTDTAGTTDGAAAPTDPTAAAGESLLQKIEHGVEIVVEEVVHVAEEVVDAITGHESAEAGTPGESQESGGESAPQA